MNDEEFVVRVAHIIISGKLENLEQLHLIRLLYWKMAFPEIPLPEDYNRLMKKLYGENWNSYE